MSYQINDEAQLIENCPQGAQAIIVDSGKHVAANVICAAICGMSLVIAVVSGIVTWNLNTEVRVTQSKYEAVKNRQSELEGELRALRSK